MTSVQTRHSKTTTRLALIRGAINRMQLRSVAALAALIIAADLYEFAVLTGVHF